MEDYTKDLMKDTTENYKRLVNAVFQPSNSSKSIPQSPSNLTETPQPPSSSDSILPVTSIYGFPVVRGNKLTQFERKGPPPFGLKEKELIILAMGPSRGQCPFDCEVWALNMGHQQIDEMKGKLDKLFMAHGQVINKQTKKKYFDWNEYRKMADEGIELINIHRVKDVPFKIYPLKRLIEKFQTDYFTDTICYMLAYALDKSVDRIDNHFVFKENPYTRLKLYGVDMQQKDEYQWEKPGIEFWLGICKGIGIDYTISEGSALFDTVDGTMYGMKSKLNMKDIDPLGLLKIKSTEQIMMKEGIVYLNSPAVG